MKFFSSKFIALILVFSVSVVMPQLLPAQQAPLVGELVITKSSPEATVLVNGLPAISGASITSPSDIVTSAGATAKLVLPQTGTVSIASNSKLNLSFVNSSIAGDFLAGEITIETLPNTAINLFPPDGTITTPSRGQVNIVKILIENGRTRVDTVKGQVLFNIVSVSAGETYTSGTNTRASTDTPADDDSVSPYLIYGVLGAVGAAVLVALAVSSNDSDNSTVSPTR